jgi:hypothetical protein
MHRPVEQMIKDGEPRKPFLFCWANEGRDGSEKEVILASLN